jgi:hypothetical protein
MIMENPLDHWVRMMMGCIKPKRFKGGRVYISGQTQDDDAIERLILRLLDKHGSLRPAEIIDLSKFKKTTIYRSLEVMVSEQKIIVRTVCKDGKKSKQYQIKESE